MITNVNLENYINGFYGYGSWHHSYWVLALEERVGGHINNLTQVVDKKINQLPAKHNGDLLDNYKFQAHLKDFLEGEYAQYLDPNHKKFKKQKTWKRGIQVLQAHFLSKKGLAPEDCDYNKVIRDMWGKSDLAENIKVGVSLIELFPLPLPGHDENSFEMLYKTINPHTFTRSGIMHTFSTYVQHCIDLRTNFIINKLKKHQPEIVLAMGINDYNAFAARLVNEFKVKLNEGIIKNSRYKTLNIDWGNTRTSRIIITCQPNGAWAGEYWNGVRDLLKN